MYDVLRFSIRPYLRACVLVGSGFLASFQVNAQAVQDWDFQRFYAKTVDGVGTVGFAGGSGSPVAATYNLPTAGAGGSLNVSGTARVPTAGGRSALVTLSGNLSKPSAAKAFKAAVVLGGGPIGFAFFAIPAVLDWMNASGVGVSTASGQPVFTSSELHFSGLNPRTGTYAFQGNIQTVCAAIDAAYELYNDGPYTYTPLINNGIGSCNIMRGTQNIGSSVVYVSTSQAPVALADLEQYMDEPTLAPAYVDALKAAGVTVGLTSPQLSGQASTASTTKQTSKVNPDGSTTTTSCSTSDALLYNSANMTFSTVETCTTTNPAGTTAGQTQTATSVTTSNEPTSSPAEEQKSDLCKDNPDIVACQTLGADDTQIPKTDKDVTYVQESRFGGGACPADKYQTINGVNLKVWDWAQACGYIVNWVRPLLLLLAAWSSLMIVSGVRTENPV